PVDVADRQLDLDAGQVRERLRDVVDTRVFLAVDAEIRAVSVVRRRRALEIALVDGIHEVGRQLLNRGLVGRVVDLADVVGFGLHRRRRAYTREQPETLLHGTSFSLWTARPCSSASVATIRFVFVSTISPVDGYPYRPSRLNVTQPG